MSSLRQSIEAVLKQRQAHLPALKQTYENLKRLRAAILRGQTLAEQIGTAEAVAQQTKAGLLSEKLRDFPDRISEVQAKLRNLGIRFAKRTINIGVAGTARQGKSTLLRAVSGLGDEAIPTSDGLPCTGAKSKILHSESESHAEIEFFSEREFLQNVVHAYYEHLKLPHRPRALAEFKRAELKLLAGASPGENAFFDILKKLQAGLPHFEPLLSCEPRKIPIQEVRSYVAQRDEKGRDTHQYLAVRCANIFARFRSDVTGLAMIDLPGLGELARGHAEKLAASLRQEIDAVLVVKRPDALGDKWSDQDVRVIDLVKEAAPELELADWMFWVLNRLRNDKNAEIIKALCGNQPDVGAPLLLLTADCSNADEVDEKIFLPVVKHMQQNLANIDRKLLDDVHGRIEAVVRDIREAVGDAAKLFSPAALDADGARAFDTKFDDFLASLRSNLSKLRREYQNAGGDFRQAAEYADLVDKTCDAMQATPPTSASKDLQQFYEKAGGWPAVIQGELHHARAHLVADLSLRLDEYLRRISGEALAELFRRLLPEALRAWLPSEGDARQQLRALHERLDTSSQSTLASGLDYLVDFQYSFNSHFDYHIRKELDQLDPQFSKVDLLLGPQADADTARNALDHIYKQAVYNVGKKLKTLRQNPQQIIESLVCTARDRLAWAPGVEQEWRHFLFLRRAEIWPDVFDRFAKDTALAKDWETAMREIVAVADALSATR